MAAAAAASVYGAASGGADAAAAAAGLTPEQVAAFHRDGYLVIPGWWDAATIAAVKARADEMLMTFEPPAKHSVFTTKEQARTSDEYFLTSGDKVRYFFEEGALAADGSLTKPQHLAVNKIGHNLHELVPEFREVSFDARLAAVCRSLGYERPVIPQSMYICKQAHVGGAVLPHQDGTFLYTEPSSVMGFWWPLEECTLSNGCLWAVPGSHKAGVARRFKRAPDGAPGTVFDPPAEVPFDLTGAVPLEVAPGTLVMLHNALVHYSERNESGKSRHAYAIHLVEAGKGTVYPADNWLQRDGGAPFPDLYPEFRPATGTVAGAVPPA